MTASSNGAQLTTRTLVSAAAAASEGAAATPEPQHAPPPPGADERRYRLTADETVAAGLRRVARGQIADSADALARASGDEQLGEAVHTTRKAMKRVRTTLRLSRDALGEDVYQREKEQMNAIADALAGARDAQVLMETLDLLTDGVDDTSWSAASGGLRARMRDEHDHAIARLEDGNGAAVVAARRSLEQARSRAGEWQLRGEDFAAVAPGLRRIYRQGRRRMRTARAEPTAEHLHDARKRVKDLWHAAQLLRPAAPKRMKRLARDAHALADLLGDHHDLSVLRSYVEHNPRGIAELASRDALLAAIDARRDELAQQALELGRRVYRRKPRRFVAEMAAGWAKRVGAPQPDRAR